MRRTHGAQVASARVAVDKARTASIFVRPSREMEEQVSGGRLGALALHGASCLTGGIPLKVGDEVVGAVGTSGETPDEDEAISIAGAAAAFSTTEVPALTYAGARLAAEAVGAAAAQRGVAPVVSAVDAGGELIFLVRPDAAQVASVQVTTDKARTAAIYRRPSKDFEDQAVRRTPVGAAPRARGAAAGRHADRVRRRGHRRGRGQRRAFGRRGPRAGRHRRRGLRGRAGRRGSAVEACDGAAPSPLAVRGAACPAARAAARPPRRDRRPSDRCRRRARRRPVALLRRPCTRDRLRRGRWPDAADPLGPGDVPNRTYDVVPHAQGAGLRRLGLGGLAPADTQRRLSQGRVCFNWYRTA